MIPEERQRLRQPERPRSTEVQRPTTPVVGRTLSEAHAGMDAATPYVCLQYAEARLHAVVGPFLDAALAREWGQRFTEAPATGFRIVPVSPVRPLLPAPPLWSR